MTASKILVLLLVSLSTCMQLENEPTKGIFRLFDKFGLDTSAIITGGCIVLRCIAPKGTKCDKTSMALMTPDGKELKSYECFEDDYYGEFIMNITKTMVLGDYTCKYKNIRAKNSFHFGYRICDDREDLCAKDTSCTQNKTTSCVVSKKAAQHACGNIPNGLCMDHPSNPRSLCPGKYITMCNYLERGWSQRVYSWFIHVGAEDCPELDDVYARILYNGTVQPYEWPIRIYNKHASIKITYKNSKSRKIEGLTAECTTWKLGRDIQLDAPSKTKMPANELIVPLSKKIFTSGTMIYKLNCIFIDPTDVSMTIFALLRNTLVYIDENATVSITGERDAKGVFINHLVCHLNPLPSDDFLIQYWWQRKGNSKNNISGSDLQITRNAQYQCFVQVTYKSCSPHVEFQSKIWHSQWERALYQTPTTTMTMTTTTGATTATTTAGAQNFTPVLPISMVCVIVHILATILQPINMTFLA